MSGNFAGADIYIKDVVRTDTYVDGKLVSSKQTAVNELWIADKKITYITPPRILIVDLEEKRISIVNRSARTYMDKNCSGYEVESQAQMYPSLK